MATIRERVKANGTRIFHVQVRMTGFPARTASFPTRRQAERWAKTIEADMIEGKHFRSAEARRLATRDHTVFLCILPMIVPWRNVAWRASTHTDVGK